MPLDKRGQPYSDPIFAGNPHVARPGEHYDGTIPFVNGTRAYIEHASRERYTFREYTPHPALIELPPRAKEMAKRSAGAVVFNPTIKYKAPTNKQWSVVNWRDLIERSRTEIRWIQVGEPGGPKVRFAERADTGDFWDALGLLSGARAVVCHEGALHHAAAALGVPAVVIRGGFIGPKVTGYAGQVDFFVETPDYPLGCGHRIPCVHCKAAMDSITPAKVLAALRSLLREPAVA